MIWSAVGEKGGPGKSTLISNLAVYFAEQGKKVLVLDFDPNQSLTVWSRARKRQEKPLKKIPVMHVANNTPEEILEQIDIEHLDEILMDVPGSDDYTLREAIRLSDVCVMPTRDGGFDYMAFNHLLKALEKAHELKTKHKQRHHNFLFLNSTRPNSKVARMTKRDIKQKVTSTIVLEEELGILDDFKLAAMTGMGVIEYDETGQGQSHFRGLMSEIFKTLEAQDDR